MLVNNCSLVVSTFDGYAVCWPVFCHGLHRYWPDCPYEVRFITNYLESGCGSAIKVGLDKRWSDNMLVALAQIETPYILYAQEDYWLKSEVDTAIVSDYIRLLNEDRADYIRLHPVPGPDMPFSHDSRLGIIAQDAHYRTSLQMALWRKSVLQQLLVPGESGWQFETLATERSRVYTDRFLSVTRRKFGMDYTFTAIVDGEWSPAAYQYAKDEGISIDFAGLPRKPWYIRLRKRIKNRLSSFARRTIRKFR